MVKGSEKYCTETRRLRVSVQANACERAETRRLRVCTGECLRKGRDAQVARLYAESLAKVGLGKAARLGRLSDFPSQPKYPLGG